MWFYKLKTARTQLLNYTFSRQCLWYVESEYYRPDADFPLLSTYKKELEATDDMNSLATIVRSATSIRRSLRND